MVWALGLGLGAPWGLSGAATAWAQSALSEEAATRAALGCSASLAAAEAQVRAAQAERTAARWGLAPELAVSGRYTRLSSVPASFRSLNFSLPGAPMGSGEAVVFPQLLDQFAGRLTLTLPLSDLVLRAWHAAEAAGAREEARRWEATAALAQVEFETRVAWHEWRRARNAQETLEAAVEAMESQRRATAARLAQGIVAPTQLQVLEVEVSSLRRQRLTASGSATAAGLRVQRLTCLEVLPSPGDAQPLGSPADSQQRPEIAALLAESRQLQAQSRVAAAALFPSLAVVAGADLAAPNPRAFAQTELRWLATWDVSVQLSWSLTGAMQSRATARGLDAAREAVAARQLELARAIREERSAAAASIEVAQARRGEAESALALATRLEQARRAEFSAGTATAVEVSAAASQRLRAALDLQDAEVETALGTLRLRYAAGLLGRAPTR